jgi:hypothetical protein
MIKPVKTSVVILNWNGEWLMAKLLDQVVKHTLNKAEANIEIVVADNGSTDGSLDFLRTNFADTVRCIDLQHNHGFAEGYNLALSQVKAEYVVLLNSDVEVTPGWLSILTDYLDNHPDVVACQPKIKSLTQRDHFEHAGASGGFIDRLGYPFCRGRVLSEVELDKGQYDQETDIFWASGACMCIRLAEYRGAGGLDARFFAHMEEIDLCWRLRSRGKRIVCVPQSVVYHLGGATLQKSNPQKTYLNYRNNLLMLYKNLPQSRLIPVFITRMLMDYLSAVVFLCTGKTRDAAAVVKARFHFWKMKKRIKIQRVENTQAVRLTNIPEVYPGSILLEHYLLGKSRFTDFFS